MSGVNEDLTMMDAEQEEILFAHDGRAQGNQQASESLKFDTIVGALEDLLVNDEFAAARDSFCRANCHQFEDTAENKLIYTPLHQQYCQLLENTVATALVAAVPDFDMGEFLSMLEARQDELGCSDAFDLLVSLSDFTAFKELMLAYKAEGAAQAAAASMADAQAADSDGGSSGCFRPGLPALRVKHLGATADAALRRVSEDLSV